MSLSIRTNVASLDAQRNLNSSQNLLNQSMSQLSSGYRITSAGDDAAGLGISSKLEAQIASYGQAGRNANDGVSVIQTTESSLNETTNILTRLRELAMESASDGIGNSERAYVQTESDQLVAEVDRSANVAQYDGTNLLSGAATALHFQVGVGSTTNDQITFSTLNATATALGVNGLTMNTQATAQAALSTIDAALALVSTAQATLGAVGNRFQSAINNIQSFSESLSAADSRIKDVDVAQATSQMARAQILQQAGVSVLAQANQAPQLALKLLQ
jgi:flagellin